MNNDRKLKRKREKEEEKAKKPKIEQNVTKVEIKSLRQKVPRKIKLSSMENIKSNFHIGVDLSLDNLMTCSMLKMLARQLLFCYNDNKKQSKPSQLWFINQQERLKRTMQLSYKGHENWDINWFQNDLMKLPFNKTDIIYLSSDSETTLEKLETGKIYIIGGLVDRNSHKGYCRNKAVSLGLQTAKLPLEKFVNFQSLKRPLTVNHVCEIISKVNSSIIESKDDEPSLDSNLTSITNKTWENAIITTLPQRKNAKIKTNL